MNTYEDSLWDIVYALNRAKNHPKNVLDTAELNKAHEIVWAIMVREEVK